MENATMQTEPRPQVEQTQAGPASGRDLISELRRQQNLGFGIVGGLAGAAAGAGLWAVITVTTGYQIGWMAVGVGFLVGVAVRMCGRGIDAVFGVVGAILALVGCLVGNVLGISAMVAEQEQVAMMQILANLTPTVMIELLWVTFSPVDLLFYGIAIYEGYRFSFRQIHFVQSPVAPALAQPPEVRAPVENDVGAGADDT